MKLRQKFAAVMATAMVVSAVPVVTMAASSNTMTRPVKTVETDGSFAEASTAGALQIKFTGAVAPGKNADEEVFYLTLENAKWNKEALKQTFGKDKNSSDVIELTKNEYFHKNNNSDATPFVTPDASGVDVDNYLAAVAGHSSSIEFESDTVVKITLQNIHRNDIMLFPLIAEDISGEAKVKVETKGSGSTISEGEYVFATTAEKKLNFSIGDMTTVYEDGELADINFTETFKGAFKKETANIEVELKDADYEFDFDKLMKPSSENDDYVTYDLTEYSNKQSKDDNKLVKLSQGFSGQQNNIKVLARVDKDDLGACEFIISGATEGSSIGKITLQNLPVRNDERDITTGDLLADIKNASGSVLGNSATNVKVAEITAYSNYITMKDSKPVDIVAGRIEKVEFVVGENIADSFGAGREFELTLDNDAHFNYKTGATLYNGSTRTNDIVKDQTQVEVNSAKQNIIQSIKVDSNDNNKLIVRLNDRLNTKDTKDKVKLELEVCVPVASKEDEKVTITASGRALAADISTTAINIVNPFDVKMEALQLKVGLQDQVGGKITIEETEKEMFMKGKLELKVVDPATGETVSGIKFYNKNFVDYSTTGDIKKADLDTVNSNGVAAIDIKRQSSSASTLELKDFHVTVDRSVPEGKYDLVLTGSAIDEHGAHVKDDKDCTSADRADADYVHYTDEDQRDLHKITVKDFLIVGTPNTDDLAVNGLRKGTVEFKVGESKYTVNGKEVAMDAASYIQDPGFTMVPVRYVAESFGISSKDILFSSGGTVTIITGSRTVQLQNNSDIALVNGAQVKMGTKVVIKDGRTYAPIGEVAQILGVQKGWDNTTKTATFTN